MITNADWMWDCFTRSDISKSQAHKISCLEAEMKKYTYEGRNFLNGRILFEDSENGETIIIPE